MSGVGKAKVFCCIATLTAFAENPADLSFTLAAKENRT